MNHPHFTRNNGRNGTNDDDTTLPTMNQLMGVLGRLTEVVGQTVDINQAEAARRVGQPQRHDTLDNFLKKHPPSFDGTPNPTVVTSWKDKLERIFEAMACTDEEKVRFAVFTLESEAANWWRTTKARFERDGTEVTWATFLIVFDNQYFSETVKDKLEKEFHDLVQGENTVAVYESKFTALVRYAENISNDEGRKARKFVQGLSTQLREKMAINRYESYGLAVQHATNLEINLPSKLQNIFGTEKRQREEGYDSDGRNNNKRPMRDDNKNQGNPQGMQIDKPCATCNRKHQGACYPQCPKCSKRHLGDCYPLCPKCNRRHIGECQGPIRTCYNCGEGGHLSRFCLKPRNNNIGRN